MMGASRRTCGPHWPSGRAVVSSAPRAFTPIFVRRQRLRLSPCLPARTARTRGARSANARPGLGIVLASACDAAQRADSHEGDYSLDSIIASAILSGVGPVCPECLSRGHVPALRLPPEEVYSFGLTDPPAQLDWDIHAARALIAAGAASQVPQHQVDDASDVLGDVRHPQPLPDQLEFT